VELMKKTVKKSNVMMNVILTIRVMNEDVFYLEMFFHSE
jgi:hypothetical protein